MTMTTVTNHNAYEYADNFAIFDSSGFFVATEHNHTEAKALARFLESTKGHAHTVRKNGVDAVRAAQAMGAAPRKHALRDEAFAAMGVI